MSLCRFEKIGSVMACPACGQSVPILDPSLPADRYFANCQKGGPMKLGDRIEQLAQAVGIPTCGGCEARKAALNKLSDWWNR